MIPSPLFGNTSESEIFDLSNPKCLLKIPEGPEVLSTVDMESSFEWLKHELF